MELKLAATDLIKVVLKRAPAFKVGTVSVMLRDTYFGDGYFDWDWHTFSGPNIGKNIGKAVRGGPEALIEKRHRADFSWDHCWALTFLRFNRIRKLFQKQGTKDWTRIGNNLNTPWVQSKVFVSA